jgi:hypothetical protein
LVGRHARSGRGYQISLGSWHDPMPALYVVCNATNGICPAVGAVTVPPPLVSSPSRAWFDFGRRFPVLLADFAVALFLIYVIAYVIFYVRKPIAENSAGWIRPFIGMSIFIFSQITLNYMPIDIDYPNIVDFAPLGRGAFVSLLGLVAFFWGLARSPGIRLLSGVTIFIFCEIEVTRMDTIPGANLELGRSVIVGLEGLVSLIWGVAPFGTAGNANLGQRMDPREGGLPPQERNRRLPW